MRGGRARPQGARPARGLSLYQQVGRLPRFAPVLWIPWGSGSVVTRTVPVFVACVAR